MNLFRSRKGEWSLIFFPKTSMIKQFAREVYSLKTLRELSRLHVKYGYLSSGVPVILCNDSIIIDEVIPQVLDDVNCLIIQLDEYFPFDVYVFDVYTWSKMFHPKENRYSDLKTDLLYQNTELFSEFFERGKVCLNEVPHEIDWITLQLAFFIFKKRTIVKPLIFPVVL